MGGSEQAGRADCQGLMLWSNLTATQESRGGG